MEHTVNPGVEYPEMRNNVIAALRALSDEPYQQRQWGRWEEGIDYYDDLRLCLSILYDDTDVLPDPSEAVPAVLRAGEVPPLEQLARVLGPLLAEHGERAEEAYLRDPKWSEVVAAARSAIAIMKEPDRST